MISYVVLVVLIILSIEDIRFKEISLKYISIIAISNIVFMIIENQIMSNMKKIIFLILLFTSLYLIFKKYIGLGDIVLLASMSICLSLEQLVCLLFLSSFLASFVGVLLIIIKKVNRKAEMPFVPFIAVSYLAMFIGGVI